MNGLLGAFLMSGFWGAAQRVASRGSTGRSPNTSAADRRARAARKTRNKAAAKSRRQNRKGRQ